MHKYFLIILLLISGCDVDNNNHGYGYSYDLTTPQGIRIQFEGEPTDVDMNMIDQAFMETSACMGLGAPPPMIVAKTEVWRFYIDGEDYAGVTYFDPLLIAMANHYLREREDFLKHEYVHYILDANGFDRAMNINHDSVYFYSCSMARW